MKKHSSDRPKYKRSRIASRWRSLRREERKCSRHRPSICAERILRGKVSPGGDVYGSKLRTPTAANPRNLHHHAL
ncbi:hypothetical protein [uncultured Nostoc sp.]|uniref:hypothetical protein n=1 Tax=uncultured Nostoc sp. TaxID=340711 RepID=UPI0035CAE394